MSVSFTQVAVGAPQSPAGVLRALGEELHPLEFAAGGTLFRVDYDAEDDDYVDAAPLDTPFLAAYSAPGALDRAPGLGVAFRGGGREVVARAARQRDETVVLFVDMSDRTLYDFFAHGEAETLRRLLTAGARACAAPASFAAMELEWKPYTEASILDAIVRGPEGYDGQPPPFAVIRPGHVRPETVPGFPHHRFETFPTADYWVLQRQHLEDTFGAMPR